MVRKFFIAAALVLLLCNSALAADYKFAVDENYSEIIIREDGGIDIKYRMTFTCAKNGKPIDIVDVGLPNSYFELDSVRAWINDNPVSDIKNSSFIPVGVEVPLTGHEINPGRTGTLRLEASNPHMVFPDSDDANFASVEFYPTYFGSEFTTGATKLRVAIHFPIGADSQQVKWHYSEFNEVEQDREGRLVYVWKLDQASPSQQYKFGVSFPKTLVKNIFEPVQDVYSVSSENPRSLSSKILEDFGAFMFFIGWVLFIVVGGTIANRRRKMKYFPPVAAVEGVEIKRGLTAPEAAILLEVPLNKVAAMIIFGLKKKGVIDIATMPKLNIKVLNINAPDLHPYEKSFLELIDANGAIPEKSLSLFFVKMIRETKDNLKGFNLKKTRQHYRSIIDQAWQQVKSSGTDAEAGQLLDQSFSWLMIDKNMDDKLKDSLGDRQVSTPIWFFSGGSHSGGTSVRPGSVSGVQFANQVVSRIEGVANSAVTRLEGFTGGITDTTNPVPKSSGGGSGGGGCACACAGCACACAGGGR